MWKMKISLVIPTYNEEQGLYDLIIASRPHCDEILIVDGGSSDNTVKEALRAGVKVYHDNGRGKGDAIRTGFVNAQYDIVIFMDADWSHNPDDIIKLAQPIRDNQFDLVIGSRVTGGSAEWGNTLNEILRREGSKLITWSINKRFNKKISDSQNGFRAIRKDKAMQLKLIELGTTIEQEMLIRALATGLRVGEVPSFESRRRYGHSKIKLTQVSHKYIYCLIRDILFPLQPQ